MDWVLKHNATQHNNERHCVLDIATRPDHPSFQCAQLRRSEERIDERHHEWQLKRKESRERHDE